MSLEAYFYRPLLKTLTKEGDDIFDCTSLLIRANIGKINFKYSRVTVHLVCKYKIRNAPHNKRY